MKSVLLTITVLLLLTVLVLSGIRVYDTIAESRHRQKLAGLQPEDPPVFDHSMVAGLPEPAQRFFRFAIQPGTPLYTVAEIEMGGEFSLSSKDAPDYQSMQAFQILAAPHGFLWKLNLPGPAFVSGSDSDTWTRFRILGIIPVARMGGEPNHSRAAFGRYVAEAVFWTPAAVLPSKNVVWQPVDANTASVTISHGGLSQEVFLTVDHTGKPVKVEFQRWSDANPEKKHKLQPFGGILSDFRDVQGFMLPFDVKAANHFATEDEFFFFQAKVKEIRFVNR